MKIFCKIHLTCQELFFFFKKRNRDLDVPFTINNTFSLNTFFFYVKLCLSNNRERVEDTKNRRTYRRSSFHFVEAYPSTVSSPILRSSRDSSTFSGQVLSDVITLSNSLKKTNAMVTGRKSNLYDSRIA